MAKQQIQKPKQDNVLITCVSCGSEKLNTTYYQSRSRTFKFYGRLPVCKICIAEMFKELHEKYESNKRAIYELCQKYDVCFNNNSYLGAVQDVSKTGKGIFQAYFSKINSFGAVNKSGSDFSDSDRLTTEEDLSILKGQTSSEESGSNSLLINLDENFEFTEQDQQAKDDVIRLVGYEVFAGYSKFDQKFLYNELLPHLDEDNLDDTFKISQIMQLVNNNNQIRKIDLVINKMSSDVKSLILNQSDIKTLTATKNQIVTSTDKIAKENSISAKNRGDKKSGKSTLGTMMKDLRELKFDKAEQDYYDMSKAYGMQQAVDISNKSILDILKFDDNDLDHMLKLQRTSIQDLQQKELDLNEKIRVLSIENMSLKSKPESI